MSQIIFRERATPSTPASGQMSLFSNTSGDLAWIDDGGFLTTIVTTGAATITLPNATDTVAVLGTQQTFTARPIFSTTIGVGGVTPSTSGIGISFPATQSASSDVNTLDDYEEGTWTPVWTTDATGFGSINYNTSGTFGIYTKIGDTVYVTGGISTDTFAVGSASGNVQVGGLPYIANSTANRFGGICVTYALTFASTTRRPFSGIVQNNTTKFWTYYRTSSEGDVANAATGDMRTGTNSNANKMYFFGFYQI